MNRLAHSLLLVLFLAFQAGTAVSVLSDCCPEETAAECATDQCGEDCGACVCALDRSMPAPPAITLSAPIAPVRVHAEMGEVLPPEPRSGDILHVPRALLA